MTQMKRSWIPGLYSCTAVWGWKSDGVRMSWKYTRPHEHCDKLGFLMHRKFQILRLFGDHIHNFQTETALTL